MNHQSSEKLSAKFQSRIRMAQYAKADRLSARQGISCMDLTSLNGSETPGDIHDLCDRALTSQTASVCIYPEMVAQAAKVLTPRRAVLGHLPLIATVINFPSGAQRTNSAEPATPETTYGDTLQALGAGAGQIDIVLDYHAFLKGTPNERAQAASLLRAARRACDEVKKKGTSALMMVILETSVFENEQDLRAGAYLSARSGADFLKTSTGKHPLGGATLEKAAVLFDVAKIAGQNLDRMIGVKIAGGISAENFVSYIALAQSFNGYNSITPARFRLGASKLLKDLNAILAQETAAPSPTAQPPEALMADY
jgi:deoxyribose-phosphate aldolase